jgi:hypothetical protein
VVVEFGLRCERKLLLPIWCFSSSKNGSTCCSRARLQCSTFAVRFSTLSTAISACLSLSTAATAIFAANLAANSWAFIFALGLNRYAATMFLGDRSECRNIFPTRQSRATFDAAPAELILTHRVVYECPNMSTASR